MAGIVHALLAAIGFATFQTVNHRALAGVDVLRGTGSLVAVGTVALGLVAVTTQDVALLAQAPSSAFLQAVAAGFIHFLGGWILLGTSQLRVGPARTGVLVGSAPLFGALVGAMALDEPLTVVALIGLVLVVGGVAVVVTAGGRTVALASGRRTAVGVLAGLGTALCWSISPIFIRAALVDLPSPVTVAAIGMAGSAVVYGLARLTMRRKVRPVRISTRTMALLLLAGTTIAFAIWMHWSALALAPVATVLSMMQLTPPLVVLLAILTGGHRGRLGRIWAGTAITVGGALIVVLST